MCGLVFFFFFLTSTLVDTRRGLLVCLMVFSFAYVMICLLLRGASIWFSRACVKT